MAFLSFTGSSGPYFGGNCYAGLVVGRDGNLYGAAGLDGSIGYGNVFRVILPGPQLSLTQVGQHLVLSWRTNYVGYTLQSSPAVTSTTWNDSTSTPVVAGGQFIVTNAISGSARFFRLKK
jgi:hypothetical protein